MTTQIRKQLLAGVSAGDSFSVTRTFTEDDLHLFTGVSHDHNGLTAWSVTAFT
jgi:hypothetical protein